MPLDSVNVDPASGGTGLPDPSRPASEEETSTKLLEALVARTSGLMGYEFLEGMVQDIAGLLGARHVFVGEFLPGLERVQSLARAVDGELVPAHQHELAGTPCGKVLADGACFVDEGVAERFPDDPTLSREGIESFYGFPLAGQDGRTVGAVIAMHTEPMRSAALTKTVFQLLAARAGAEVSRIRFDRVQALRVSQVHRHLSILNELSMSSALRHGRVQELADALVDQLRESLDADRASVWMTDEGGLTLRRLCFRSRAGHRDPGVASLPLSEIRQLLMSGREKKALVSRHGPAGDLPPHLADHLTRQGIRSRIESAIRLGSEIVGVVSVSTQDGDREWTDEEQLFVGEIADLLGHAVLEARRREAEMDRSRLELELERAKKMEALGGLAGGIAHDFNNILASILGNAELARYEEPEALPELMSEILTAAEQGRELVNQILQFARSEEPNRSPVDLAAVADEVARTARPLAPKHADFQVEVEADCPSIQGDPVQLGQVILNLCTNAFAALDEPGHVTLRVRQESSGVDTPSGPPEWVVLEVADSGRGMDDEVKARLFEPFFTTRKGAGGTGLGLAIVDRTVRAHGGTIIVDSTPGVGTRFEFRFPVVETERRGSEVTERRQRMRVVAVDDDEDVLVLIRALLEHLHHEVQTFQQPADAIAHLDGSDEVDVVVTDLFMEGFSGVQLAEEVLKRRPQARTIIMSASPERLVGGRGSGIHGVLPKPFSLHELAGALSALG